MCALYNQYFATAGHCLICNDDNCTCICGDAVDTYIIDESDIEMEGGCCRCLYPLGGVSEKGLTSTKINVKTHTCIAGSMRISICLNNSSHDMKGHRGHTKD